MRYIPEKIVFSIHAQPTPMGPCGSGITHMEVHLRNTNIRKSDIRTRRRYQTILICKYQQSMANVPVMNYHNVCTYHF
jgi:hypothetical protein